MVGREDAVLFTSPRVRGEVDVRAKRGRRVRGHDHDSEHSMMPLTRLAPLALATLSPQAGRGKKAGKA